MDFDGKMYSYLLRLGCEPEFLRDETQEIKKIVDEEVNKQVGPKTEELCAAKLKDMELEITEKVRKEFEVEKSAGIRNLSLFLSESAMVNGSKVVREDFFTIRPANDPEYNEKQLILNTYFDNWQLISRTGASVFISNVHVIACMIVNASGPGQCHALLIFIKGRASPLLIKNGDLSDKNIISELRNENISYRTKYVAEAFRRSLYLCTNVVFLTIPVLPGWNLTPDGKNVFVCSAMNSPMMSRLFCDSKSGLDNVFEDIVLVPNQRSINEIAEAFRTEMSESISIKTAAVITSLSRLLPFFKEEGLSQDKVWVEETAADCDMSLITTLIDNRDSGMVDKIFSSDHISKLNLQLKKHNDCVFVVRHRSYLESEYELIKVLKLTANVTFAYDESNRTVPVLAIDNLGLIPDDFPMQQLPFDRNATIGNIGAVRRVIGEINSFLINYAETNPEAFRSLLKSAIRGARELSDDLHYELKSNSLVMFLVTAIILKEFKIFSFADLQEIMSAVMHKNTGRTTAASAACNSIGFALSEAIINGKLRISNQFSPPFWGPEKAFIANDGSVNTTREMFGDILSDAKIPFTLNKTLNYLKSEDYSFPDKSGNQRTITVYNANNKKIQRRFVSLSYDLLSEEAKQVIEESISSDLFHKVYPEGFIPFIGHPTLDMVAGQVMTDYRKANPFICVTGAPGSRKTTFLMMQALQRAMNGETVLAFDVGNSFSPEEIQEHQIPEDIFNKYFVFWDISRDGWPVDLIDCGYHMSREQKINRLNSLLISGTRLKGPAQLSILKNKICLMLDENSDIKDISCICRYFDDSDPGEKLVHDRLEALFSTVKNEETFPQKWENILGYRGKVIVFSNGVSTVNSDLNIMDMLLDSLYSYKDSQREQKLTVVIDEVQKMNLRAEGPLNSILSLGRKLNLSLIVASQIFACDNTDLARIEGYCDTKIFCRPMDSCLEAVAKATGISQDELSLFDDGYCAIAGPVYSEYYNKNKPVKPAVCGYMYRLPELGEYE